MFGVLRASHCAIRLLEDTLAEAAASSALAFELSASYFASKLGLGFWAFKLRLAWLLSGTGFALSFGFGSVWEVPRQSSAQGIKAACN